jgi:multicomponent Na+:H+ antiporter subunit C
MDLGQYNYWLVVLLMMTGLYALIARGNLIRKLIGLNVFQVSVFLLYISAGFIREGAAPILTPGVELYSNPLPHVLILTAIVVGVATTAFGLALAVRIHDAYGSIDDQALEETADRRDERSV